MEQGGSRKGSQECLEKNWPSRSVLFVQVCIWERACVLLCVSVSSTLTAREWLWDWNVVPVRAFFKIRNILALQTNWGYFWSQRSFVLILLQSSIPRLPLKKPKKNNKNNKKKKTFPPHFNIESQLWLKLTDGDAYEFQNPHGHF